MESGMSAWARLPCLVAVSTKIKVVAHETFVPLARKSTLTTSITAHSWAPGIREKEEEWEGRGMSGGDRGREGVYLNKPPNWGKRSHTLLPSSQLWKLHQSWHCYKEPSFRTTNHKQSPSLFIWYDRGNISGNSSEPKLYLCNKHLMHINNILDY